MRQTSIDHGSYASILPHEYYTSREIFAEELEKVFSRQWLLVGHACSVKSPGDFFVKQVGPESLIITRDSQKRVRVYFNVCRHRGSRMLEDRAQGSARNFVCPYHKWAWNTDGCLRSATGHKDGEYFDYARFPLHEAQVSLWYGWIYVWLGTEAAPRLEEVLGPVTDRAAMDVIGSEQLKLAHREIYTVRANWKTLLENNMECHHCGHGGHPSLAIACDYARFAADKHDGAHFPLRARMATFSMDGKRVSAKPLGTPQPDGFSTGFLLAPLFCGPVFFVDHAVSLELTPLSQDTTQLVCEWYVHEEALEDVDYDRQKLIEVFHVTNLEDGIFAERNYRGVQSMRFVPGPLHPLEEPGIKSALTRYLDMMAT